MYTRIAIFILLGVALGACSETLSNSQGSGALPPVP